MSSYTDSLGLEEITPGDQAGLWGNTTNNNLALIDQAVTGVTPLSFSGLSGSVRELETSNGALDEARAAVLNITGTATGPNTVVVPNKQKTYLVRNNTGQNVTFRTATPGLTYPVEAGNSILIFCDGNNNVFTGIASPSVGTLSVSAGGTGQTTFGGGGFVKSSGGTNALGVSAAVALGSEVSGTLPVTNGGTGAGSFVSGSLLVGNSTGNLGTLVGGANGQVATWNGSTWAAAPPVSGAISTVFGRTGAITAQAGDYSSFYAPATGSTVYSSLSGTNTFSGANTFGNNGAGTGTPIFGSTNNAGAASGFVGQTITASGSNIPLVSGATAIVATLSLPAGDWDIFGTAFCNSANLSSFICAANTTAAIVGSVGIYSAASMGPVSMPIPFTPIIVGTTTPVYLLVNVGFPSGSPTASGNIFARRVR